MKRATAMRPDPGLCAEAPTAPKREHTRKRALTLACAMAAPAGAAAHGGGLDWDGAPADAWLVLGPLLLATGLYLAGVAHRCAHAAMGSRPAQRALAFGLGLLLLVFALVWPLDGWAEHAFSAHMAQHMVLMVLAPPLLIAGRPLGVWLRGLPRRWRPAAVALRARLAPPALRRLAAHLGLATVLHGAAMWFWHVPWLFDLALRHEGVHWLEHITLLGSGLLFWWALLHAPRAAFGSCLLALLSTTVHSGLLGALLTLAPRPLYGSYLPELGWAGALADQQLAGLIMWVPMGTVYLMAALWIVGRALGAGGALPGTAQAGG